MIEYFITNGSIASLGLYSQGPIKRLKCSAKEDRLTRVKKTKTINRSNPCQTVVEGITAHPNRLDYSVKDRNYHYLLDFPSIWVKITRQVVQV